MEQRVHGRELEREQSVWLQTLGHPRRLQQPICVLDLVGAHIEPTAVAALKDSAAIPPVVKVPWLCTLGVPNKLFHDRGHTHG